MKLFLSVLLILVVLHLLLLNLADCEKHASKEKSRKRRPKHNDNKLKKPVRDRDLKEKIREQDHGDY